MFNKNYLNSFYLLNKNLGLINKNYKVLQPKSLNFFKKFFFKNYKFKFDFFSYRRFFFFLNNSYKKNLNFFYNHLNTCVASSNIFFLQKLNFDLDFTLFFDKHSSKFFLGSFFSQKLPFFSLKVETFPFFSFYNFFFFNKNYISLNNFDVQNFKFFFYNFFLLKFFFLQNSLYSLNFNLSFFRRFCFFLKKPRLFFFFFYKRKAFLFLKKKSNFYSSFVFKVQKNLKDDFFVGRSYFGDFSFFRIFFFIFLISFFNKVRSKGFSRRNLLVNNSFVNLENSDWELRFFQKRFFRKF